MPPLQLNQVQEQTEASDSDISPKQKASSSSMLIPDDERDEREEELPRGNQSRSSSMVGKENQNMEAVRSQLLALEGMYKEILGVSSALPIANKLCCIIYFSSIHAMNETEGE